MEETSSGINLEAMDWRADQLCRGGAEKVLTSISLLLV